MSKLTKTNIILTLTTMLLLAALLAPANLLAQNQTSTVGEPTNTNTSTQTNSEPEQRSQTTLQKVSEDPASLLEDNNVKNYVTYAAIGIAGIVAVLVLFSLIKSKVKQAKDIKHHTAQPFGHVSGHATKKAKKSNPSSQVVAPGGSSPTPQPQLDVPEVKEEVINKKEVTVKESQPSPQAQPETTSNSQPMPPSQQIATDPPAATPPPSPPQPATQPQPAQPPPQNSNQTPANQPIPEQAPAQPQPEQPAASQQQEPAEDPNKPKIIVGDAIEDD